jgi:hypothetical protein
MQATVDGPTSGTMNSPSLPRFAQDHQTRTWVLSTPAPAQPSKAHVLTYAQRELAGLLRLPRGWDGGQGVPLRPEYANAALAMVALITTQDGLAAPQFSPLPSGGVDLTWLVGGDRLTITLDPEEISICGVWRTGHECFAFEPERHAVLQSELDAAVKEAQSFLLKISTRAQHHLVTS